MGKDLPTIPFSSQTDWEAWLDEHHGSSAGLWLKIAKKASGIDSVTHQEALDVALCYGWIDGQRLSFDECYFLQRFTPRRQRSKWSKRNRERIGELIAEGRLRPAGLKEVERAKDDGRWEAAYDSPRNATMSEDFESELNKFPRARAFFDNLTGRNRYAILYRIQDAKRPETRARRIAQFVEMLNEGRTPY